MTLSRADFLQEECHSKFFVACCCVNHSLLTQYLNFLFLPISCPLSLPPPLSPSLPSFPPLSPSLSPSPSLSLSPYPSPSLPTSLPPSLSRSLSPSSIQLTFEGAESSSPHTLHHLSCSSRGTLSQTLLCPAAPSARSHFQTYIM